VNKRIYNKSTGRDYSYDKKYESSPEEKARRAKRGRDRYRLEKEGKVSKGDGKDVHHRDGKNLKKPTVVPKSKNRGIK
jgi:hypothetical protein